MLPTDVDDFSTKSHDGTKLKGDREPDLLASFFTLAGDLIPLPGVPFVSPIQLQRRARAATLAGFRGMGLASEDIAQSCTIHGYSGVRAILADNGIEHIEIEALTDWYADGERRTASDAMRAGMLEQADELGAFQIKIVGDCTGGNWPLDDMAESLAGLCRDAAAVQTRIALELFPASNLKDLDTGLALVERCGEPNAGLTFDAWHVQRGGIALEEIAVMPPERLFEVELNDGTARQTEPDHYRDTIENRLLPGEGEFDLVGLIRAANAAGFDGPYAIELLSNAHRALPVEEAALSAAKAVRTLLTSISAEHT